MNWPTVLQITVITVLLFILLLPCFPPVFSYLELLGFRASDNNTIKITRIRRSNINAVPVIASLTVYTHAINTS